MLELQNICKSYGDNDARIQALDNVSIAFRRHEFVAILGPSGCGKTTLLNILGGLDTADSGSMRLCTDEMTRFKEENWNAYRNNSVGFVFQNYNLVPHLNLLENVMLTLALADCPKGEQAAKAKQALQRVGLGEQITKMPNQISGGQAQRVAIARAIVNNPAIILADEPTGALDSNTSLQVMGILKKLSADHLVIMVTHNDDLAGRYADRIVRMLDGKIISDTHPHKAVEGSAGSFSSSTSMSFKTALKISGKNLLAKKKRTFKTCVAGAIAIAGMTFCLSLSNALNTMFNTAFTSTPLMYTHTIPETYGAVSASALFGGMLESSTQNNSTADYTSVTVDINNLKATSDSLKTPHKNNLQAFKQYLDTQGYNDFEVQLNKSINPLVYREDAGSYKLVGPLSSVEVYGEDLCDRLYAGMMAMMAEEGITDPESLSTLEEIEFSLGVLPANNFIDSVYSISAGRLPENENEGVLIMSNTGDISVELAYALGLIDKASITKALAGEEVSVTVKGEDVIGLDLLLAGPAELYTSQEGAWVDNSQDTEFISSNSNSFTKVKIVGVLYPHIDNTILQYYPSVIYNTVAIPQQTMLNVIKRSNEAPFMTEALGDSNPLTGVKYTSEYAKQAVLDYLEYQDMTSLSTLTVIATTEEGNQHFEQLLTKYNENLSDEEKILEDDMVTSMGKEVASFADTIGKVVAAILAVALIVSICMIGILLQVSVLERTKEIGLLRALGASKKDIHHIFDAEAIVIGALSSAIGCGGACLIMAVIDIIISLAERSFVVYIYPNVIAVVLLIVGNILLTYLAGRGPAKQAAKVTPITALRSD